MNALLTTFLLLASTALAAPPAYTTQPPAENCGRQSGKANTLKLANFYFHSREEFTTPSHQNSYGYLSFDVHHLVMDYVVHCETTSTILPNFYYAGQEWTCNTAPGIAGNVKFSYDRGTGAVDVVQKWVCYDDPVYPATYTGYYNGTVSLECDDSGVVKTPDWELGSGKPYSLRTVECKKRDADLELYQITAIA